MTYWTVKCLIHVAFDIIHPLGAKEEFHSSCFIQEFYAQVYLLYTYLRKPKASYRLTPPTFYHFPSSRRPLSLHQGKLQGPESECPGIRSWPMMDRELVYKCPSSLAPQIRLLWVHVWHGLSASSKRLSSELPGTTPQINNFYSNPFFRAANGKSWVSPWT